MGKPVWTLLPLVPDWRWMLEREDSPWYPTMRLFRQQAAGDWDAVIAAVAKALRAELRPTKTSAKKPAKRTAKPAAKLTAAKSTPKPKKPASKRGSRK
jgi:hypothetical protein